MIKNPTSAERKRRRLLERCGFRKWLSVLAIALAALWVGCGDYYRPVAIPVPGLPPSPAPTRTMLLVSSDGPQGRGSMSRLDVSGDSVISSIPAGLAPVHGALTTDGNRLYVANSGDDTVSVTPNATNLQGVTINLVRLCDASGCPAVNPVFVHTTENGRMYVADAGNGTISLIDTSSNVVTRTMAVNPAFAANPPTQLLPLPDRNSRPIGLAELPDGTKIYSVNNGNNTVTSVNTLDGTIAKLIPLTGAPLWAVASADGAHVFVVDTSGTVSVIDTLSDAVVSSIAVGNGANYLLYDKIFNRLWVTVADPSNPVARAFNVAGSTLVPVASGPVPISPAPESSCNGVPVPTSVTVLGDGSRAYVASYQTGTNASGAAQVCTQATVINSGTLASKTIPLGVAPDVSSQTGCNTARFRVFTASSTGGTASTFKVYVSQCDAGTTAVIYGFALSVGPNPHPADVMMADIPSPVSSFSPTEVAISAISYVPGTSDTPGTATYSYSLLSGPTLQPGMTAYISGMANLANNGAFVIRTATSSSFTVFNPDGATDTRAQAGTGNVIPPQNPQFVVQGQ